MMRSDARSGMAAIAAEVARDSLTDAVARAMEDADRKRARRTRRRWLVVTTLGVGLGTAIGYLWGTGELEAEDIDEYAEVVTEAAPEEVVEAAPMEVEQEQQGGLRSSFPKLAIAGAAALGIYMMRKRSDRTQEIVSEATQRARSVGEQASEQTGERAEAVAGAGEGGGESEVEEMGEEEAGDAFDDRFEGAAEEGEAVQEGSEESPEAETPDHEDEEE